MSEVLDAHRSLYDAVETGDIDLMESLWVNDPTTICVHPGAEPIIGTSAIVRSWAVLMANLGYIQFFLTDIKVAWPRGDEGDVVVVSCTENVLSGQEMPEDSFAGAKAVCTTTFVRTGSATRPGWRVWARHASPVIDAESEPEEEIDGLP